MKIEVFNSGRKSKTGEQEEYMCIHAVTLKIDSISVIGILTCPICKREGEGKIHPYPGNPAAMLHCQNTAFYTLGAAATLWHSDRNPYEFCSFLWSLRFSH